MSDEADPRFDSNLWFHDIDDFSTSESCLRCPKSNEHVPLESSNLMMVASELITNLSLKVCNQWKPKTFDIGVSTVG
ncbi:hypothetical protein EV2_044975 [Malus domestica]